MTIARARATRARSPRESSSQRVVSIGDETEAAKSSWASRDGRATEVHDVDGVAARQARFARDVGEVPAQFDLVDVAERARRRS